MPPDIQNDKQESARAEASSAPTTTDVAPPAPAIPAQDAKPADPAASAEQMPAPALEPVAPDDATVPLARLKGVQRQLSAAEKERESYRTMAGELQTRLAESEKRAAAEYAERLRATHRDIVPQLIGGETLEQVEQSLANSKAAFSAAQQAYARQLPTPPAVGNGAPRADDQTLSPLELLRAGLSQPKQDINH